MLAKLLARCSAVRATSPLDGEAIRPGHIYVARPDHHLTIEDGRVRVLRGPRENRHRPAIDPLFRTAARVFGPRVIGVILSGLQDDGSAGLYAVKERGGLTVAQDPEDAIWKDMPGRAIEYAHPDYILSGRDIAPTLVQLANTQESEPAMAKRHSISRKSNGRNGKRKPASTAGLEKATVNEEVAYPGEGAGTPSVFACPECHGVLWELKDDKMVRYRCRVGHSYGTESLAKELSTASEAALWAAVRALEEKAALQRRVAEGMGVDQRMSSRLLDQGAADTANARLIRDMIFERDAELESQSERKEGRTEQERKKTA